MAVLSLPLSFNNSFWTPDYRKGLEVLYSKLEEGTVENDEIVAFIRARAIAEGQLATSLMNPVPIGHKGTGFGADDGASLFMAFRGLQAESTAHGAAHQTVAKELQTLVADPFDLWARGYKERLKLNKADVMDNWLHSYELAQGNVARMKQEYLAKTRRADEAEDDAKFAPNAYGDHYTTSPRLTPHDPRSPPQRSATVSERIAGRLREIQRNALSATVTSPKANETVFEVMSDGEKSPTPTSTPKIDKGKGKAVDEHEPPMVASPPPMSPLLPPSQLIIEPSTPDESPAPILLAGLSMQPSAVSALLTRAKAELPLRVVRVPLLGEYQDCFHGEEFVAWLNQNVQGFGGSLDKAEEAARDLTERDNLLRRIGELGNGFEHSDNAFYQFRPKAFDLQRKSSDLTNISSPTKNLSPIAGNIMKRSNTLVNVVAKALTVKESEPAHVKARNEAEEADRAYRVAIRRLDRQRLGIEERIEDALKILQKWEGERLKAIKTVLLQYQGTLANTPKVLKTIDDRSSTLVASYQPDNDLKALMERYRTGPFHPTPHVYESVAHDESDVVFGIDLRKWAEGGWETLTAGEQKKELYPNVLFVLLASLQEALGKLPNAEKRKAWIYEVPLASVHHLRESLNGVGPDQPIPKELLAKYDAPVIASAVKLWVLELDPPLTLWEGWDEIRKLYPSVGSKANPNTAGQVSEQQHIQDLCAALIKLPKVHLYVLDALMSHFKNLIDSTPSDEDDEVYMTKLALSVGRTIIRPKSETEMTLHDRHPTLLFIDLVKNYDAIIPPTIAKKKRESERKVPLRKRTAPVDMRVVRGKISAGAPTRELYAAQHAAQKAVPPVPSLPQSSLSAAVIAPAPPVAQPQPPPVPKPEAFKAVSSPPPPPVAPVVLAPPAANSNAPQHPSFKEPPPEDDDLPPRPTFTESSHPVVSVVPVPPAVNSNEPQRPSFKEPPPEDDDLPPRPKFTESSPPHPVVAVAPAPQAVNLNEPPRPSFKEPPPEDDDLPPHTESPLPPPVAPIVPALPAANTNAPQRPSFKEPPPEDEDLPPRPSFKEPSQEDDYVPLPMPNFDGLPVSSPATPPQTEVIPPTPQSKPATPVPVKRDSLINRSISPSLGAANFRSRSPSPSDNSRASLSRSSSGQSGYVRGPRASHGPRAPGSSNVSSMVSNLNRTSVGGSPSSAPSYKRLSAGSPSRPQSMAGAVAQDARVRGIGRTQALSRRTMASDAEDEVVQ